MASNDTSWVVPKPKGTWDWENTWFNPFQSEYLARQKEAAIAEGKQIAKTTRDQMTYDRVYGPGAYNKMLESQRQAYQNEQAGIKTPSATTGNDSGFTADDLLKMFQDQQTSNAANYAAYIADMTNKINEQYDRRQQELGQNRTMSLGEIARLADQYRTNIGNIQQSYQSGINLQNEEIARRAAEQQAMAQRTAQQLAGSLTGEGISAQPITANAQNIANTLATTNQFQRDLQQRMAEIAASTHAGALSSGELVRQGAAGTLEQNYNAMLNALQNARAQQIASLQSPSSGGGGGGTSASSGVKSATDYLNYLKLFNDVTGQDNPLDMQTLLSNAAKKDPAGLLQALSSMPADQRKALGL